ncbi:uncharacterized protein PGTG_16746 [Puccinia graminis f. sp. tritici CRL 75-36-700-3]|uniref:Uncharacterized protein n=1 Tax=Puccinia graminis f. sp. tritici (strain CRL 75-36-700-3 / race SCCL) TaxID=418459 RepID=E3L2D3_PUCGT|nr:uncharacterized protein PGTG_16746 [Puccinia graminis f. sp. tritici CRL 75-36-700-3]EFP90720.2 hypothetical protein PGTG_16746 [Puccinia graminis f. sp. tritici CRL 75-36-700-3]
MDSSATSRPSRSRSTGSKTTKRRAFRGQDEADDDYLSVDSAFPSSNTYTLQAIVEIYESLYKFQRERTEEQEIQVVACITKWYDLNSVFENPFTRANGIESIVNQFLLMSLIPGHICSELGDICQSDDNSGNRVVVFSHTLHFNLLGNRAFNPDRTSVNTPYGLSVAPTPHAGTPNVISRFPSFHSAILARAGSAATIEERVLPVSRTGRGTTWPISWMFSHLSPSRMINDLVRFDLKLSTRLEFNEQARIVVHEDLWGLKETLEFLAPSVFRRVYHLQRWLASLSADFFSRRFLLRFRTQLLTDQKPCRRQSSQPAHQQPHHRHVSASSILPRSPILIGSSYFHSRDHHRLFDLNHSKTHSEHSTVSSSPPSPLKQS